MRRLLPLLLAAMPAAPAAAQMAVAVDGRVQHVPAGVVRTVSYRPGGAPTIRDEPFAGVAIPGAAIVTITETRDEDEDGRTLSVAVAMRIEPMAVAAYAGLPAPAPAPAPAPTMSPPPAAAFAGDARPLRLRRDPVSGHFIAPVTINGVAVRAIVDTGAQRTVLSAADARATGADRAIVRTTPMAGIGGATTLAVARIASLEVDGQSLGALDACIGAPGIPYTLLGQTEIARLGRIVIEDGVMTITPRGGEQLAAR